MTLLDQITDENRAAILAHAAAEAPRECCGLLIALPDDAGLVYAEAANMVPEGEHGQFHMDPAVWALVDELGGQPAAVVHSHPHTSANPSMADRAMCEASLLPWLICGWPSGHFVELQPSGWSAPLEGREFAFGVLDCYTLIQDWYRRTLGVDLPDFARTDGFWRRGEHLYRQGLEEAGFDVVDTRDPQVGDGLLMRVDSPEVDNHAAVYLGNGMMLHHLYGAPSRVERWDWPWQRRTTAIVRHVSQMGGPTAPAVTP